MNNYHKRTRSLYNPVSSDPFRLSRGKIDLFLECPRCFYLDRRLGLGRPSMPGFSLNSAVDVLLKNEFDLLRKEKKPHALMEKYGIEAVPYDHPDLPIWRDDVHQFVGASTLHKPTNLEICGIIDDVWINPKKQLIIVDYKSTSTKEEISLEDEYKQGYKKQMEVYQWIFLQNSFPVNPVGYFVYANATKERDRFDARLEFEMQIIAHTGDTSWVEPTIFEMKKCLDSDELPGPGEECEYCAYRRLIGDIERTE